MSEKSNNLLDDLTVITFLLLLSYTLAIFNGTSRAYRARSS